MCVLADTELEHPQGPWGSSLLQSYKPIEGSTPAPRPPPVQVDGFERCVVWTAVLRAAHARARARRHDRAVFGVGGGSSVGHLPPVASVASASGWSAGHAAGAALAAARERERDRDRRATAGSSTVMALTAALAAAPSPAAASPAPAITATSASSSSGGTSGASALAVGTAPPPPGPSAAAAASMSVTVQRPAMRNVGSSPAMLHMVAFPSARPHGRHALANPLLTPDACVAALRVVLCDLAKKANVHVVCRGCACSVVSPDPSQPPPLYLTPTPAEGVGTSPGVTPADKSALRSLE